MSEGEGAESQTVRHPWRTIDITVLVLVQPLMAALSLYFLLTPHPMVAHPGVFWLWIAALFLILSETIYSFSHAHYVGRTRLFVAKLILAAFTTVLSYAAVYRVLGIVDSSGQVHTGISDCIYFSLVTWTTIGYGDFYPSKEARLIAGSEGLIGYIYMATIVGLLMIEVGWRRTSR